MTNDHTIATIDTVPEADFAEQSIPAYPGDEELEPELPAATADREATEVDVLEQSIPVLFDDGYTDTADYLATADYRDTTDY